MSSPATSISSETTGARRGQLALYAICFGFFLVLLDTTALNVAMAEMEREFGGAISGLQWVVNSYTIVFASLLLACGAVGDRYGAKLLYQVGLVLFTGMSLLCALSPGVGFLIGMRALQGLGAAIMLPASLSLLSHAFPDPKERTRAVAFWASIVSLGFAAGPAIGGLLTHAFGWRSIFWINVPVGLVAWVMIVRYVTESRVPHPRHIDWGGQACAALALFSLTYALIEVGRSGWVAPRVLAGFGLAVVLGAGFVLIERFSATPVLPRSLFAKPTFTACIAVGVTLNFGMYGTLFIESLYLQNVRHLNALAAGMVILPFTLFPTLTTRVLDRSAMRTLIQRRLVIGHFVAAAGAGLMVASLASPGYALILLGLTVLGISMGFIMPAMTAGVLTSSPTETSGLASGILNSARQVGGTLGVALMGTLLQMHHAQGMFWSYGLNVVCYLAMAGMSARSVQD